jgi:hypothetical protein
MEKTKLTVRVPRELYEAAKQYAAEHNTTLTRLVSAYLRQLSIQDDALGDAPVVQRLSGTLSPEASIEDCGHYLAQKHGS